MKVGLCFVCSALNQNYLSVVLGISMSFLRFFKAGIYLAWVKERRADLGEIVSKVIANRLKPLLNSIISNTQSAFIADRLITDNVLVAFESLHHMKTNCTGKTGFMALKLDMSKAYDRVEWPFLDKILLNMGFQESWVFLIMECITTVTYSIMVNGEPKGLIILSRGLRQGDPISPYLFLFCAEGLNAIFQKVAENGEIYGFSICKNGPKLTHLFFTDDCLLFCRSTLEECEKIQELLACYEEASGQMVNKEKTTLFFSKNTDVQVQEAIKNSLGVLAIQHYEKYLGLPSFIGRNKKACFTQIKERIWAKMQGWKEKLLSQAGKEIMIKAVVQSIPTYSMSVFKLPMGLCKDIEAMIHKYGLPGHKWLSKTIPGLVVSPRPNANLNKVSDLLLHNPRQWNLDLIDNVFYPWEVDVIKGIYVSEDSTEDNLIWPLTPSGDYFVKSAYKMLSSANLNFKARSSSLEGLKGVWKGIWQIRALNRVRHFLWRDVKDPLPMKMNFHQRHVVGDALCLLCDDTQESILHSLWYCEQAQVVWRSLRSFAPLYEKHHRTFMDLFKSVLLQNSSFHVAWFATIAWCLWQWRNILWEHQPTWPLLDVGQRARNLVEEFLEVQKQALKPNINHPLVRWTPPPKTIFKANFDAAVFEHLGLARLVVVFRDSGGNIIAALSLKIKLPQMIELAEALAARRAVTLAAELSVFKVMVEGDCMRVVQALNGHGRCLTMYGHVIEEIRRLGSCLEFCSFHHVKREGNKLAYSLAHRAVLSTDIDVWVEELPENLESVFQGDLAL
nr:uncharacterized protein LOC112000487 [Quercus suber]